MAPSASATVVTVAMLSARPMCDSRDLLMPTAIFPYPTSRTGAVGPESVTLLVVGDGATPCGSAPL